MTIDVARADVNDVHPLRELHRREMNCQIVHDSFPRRGFSDAYFFRLDGRTAGYGLIANKHFPDTVNEFYVLPAYRGSALPMFRALLAAGGAKQIRAQTNDRLLTLMLYDCATDIRSENILFHDGITTSLACPSKGTFRAATESDAEPLRAAGLEADAKWLIEVGGVPVAAGGVLTHYNPPYGDIYMAVSEPHRRRGFGSYLVQELKRVAYETGLAPAARCNVDNVASRRTMENAGLLACGRILLGRVVR
jgi:GNAT superfamily N-acetyltransferase